MKIPIQKPEAKMTAPALSTTTKMETLSIVVAKNLNPELLARITEVEDELKALPAIKTQEDADITNKALKKSKSLINLISVQRKDITRPLDEAIALIIGMERSAVSTLVAMTDVKNKNLVEFAKEQDRLAAIEKERIRKEAEGNAAKEQARVAGIMATKGAFEKSAIKAIHACTLETIDSKIKGLNSLKFDKAIYQEFTDQMEALRPVLLNMLAEKRIQLQQLADLAKKDANKAAEVAQKAKDDEAQALKNIDFKTAQDTATEKMNVALNEQMKSELQESTIQGGKSVSRVMVLKEVLNLMDVPYEFLMVDEKKVKEAIKMGRRSIPGLLIEEEVRNVSRG